MQTIARYVVVVAVGFIGNIVAQEAVVRNTADVANVAFVTSLSGCSQEQAYAVIQEAKAFVDQARKEGKSDQEILDACQHSLEDAASGLSTLSEGQTNFWDVLKVIIIGVIVLGVVGMVVTALLWNKIEALVREVAMRQQGLRTGRSSSGS